jgi:CubicO group peptidase (beta-lactamase class C family)
MDADLVAQARDFALTGGGSGYITRGGKLVLAWGSSTQRYDVKSTTKSFGTTLLALALLDGRLELDDPAQSCHPAWVCPRRAMPPPAGWTTSACCTWRPTPPCCSPPGRCGPTATAGPTGWRSA